jgi:membrane protein YdbS with pleckstrin-like domain
MRTRSRISGLLTVLVLIWLVIGAVAAGQRGYYDDVSTNCASVGTIAVTIVAGPLNYFGVNPTVECEYPQPDS